jgi:hypothetical protein
MEFKKGGSPCNKGSSPFLIKLIDCLNYTYPIPRHNEKNTINHTGSLVGF